MGGQGSLLPPAGEARTRGGWAIVIGIVVVLGVLIASCGSEFDVKVTSWSPGSANVAGTIKNNRSGCTDPQIDLRFRDHNDAIVQEFSFGAGELGAGASTTWSTHMIGLLAMDMPAPSNATSVSADATCADKH